MGGLTLILGGFLFGIGMTIAAGCTNKNLVRLGGGSVRSLVVLVFLAISAYMTLKGLFGQWRASYLDPITFDLSTLGFANQSIPSLLAKLTGIPEKIALLVGVMTGDYGRPIPPPVRTLRPGGDAHFPVRHAGVQLWRA